MIFFSPYEQCCFTKNLFNHLIDFRDTEDCSNDDEFIIKLYYNDAVYLIDLIDPQYN